MLIACDVPIRSVQVVDQQMGHVDSVIKRFLENFLPHIQEYTDVRTRSNSAPFPK